MPFHIGESIRVAGNNANAVVRYVGSILSFDPSEIWVGIEFDQPCGKCDGKVRVTRDGVTRDQRYFSCAPNHGCFMKATNKSISKSLTSSTPMRRTVPTNHQELAATTTATTPTPLPPPSLTSSATTGIIRCNL